MQDALLILYLPSDGSDINQINNFISISGVTQRFYETRSRARAVSLLLGQRFLKIPDRDELLH
jgi:hypothetical protein